jgi:stearoyl-CoA desaturase (delta-9 desaturase)
MAPNVITTPTGVLFEDETLSESQLIATDEESKEKYKYVRRIVWRNVLIFLYLHLAAIYGIYLAFISAKLMTTIFGK